MGRSVYLDFKGVGRSAIQSLRRISGTLLLSRTHDNADDWEDTVHFAAYTKIHSCSVRSEHLEKIRVFQRISKRFFSTKFYTLLINYQPSIAGNVNHASENKRYIIYLN